MTTTKQIRAALDAANACPSLPNLTLEQTMQARYQIEDRSRAWLAWLIGEVARRDALLVLFISSCGCNDGQCMNCDDARKLLEESK